MKLLLVEGRLILSLVINHYLLFIQYLENLQSWDVSFSNHFQSSVIGLNQDYPYILLICQQIKYAKKQRQF